MKPVVIIPTLNENDNIAILVRKILRLYPDMHIIVVDGGSTDGTIETVHELSDWNANIRLIIQEEEEGFGRALALGFKTALQGDYDPIITMDGDLSHDPIYLENFFKNDSDYGLIVASRYINGVRVEGWQFRKLLLSKLANMYISYILVKPVWDFTSGFRCYRREFLEKINLDQLHPWAYVVQVQLLSLAFAFAFRVKEFPFVFRDVHPGYSKVGSHSVFKTLLSILKYRAPLLEILRHLTYLRKDYHRFVKEYEELMNPPALKNNGQIEGKKKFSISVGVMAYNEEKLIARCLEGLLNQKLKRGEIKEILVISSGSTDMTNEIVQKYVDSYPHIRLIIQTRRLGKAIAINEFLERAGGDIVIIESADTATEPTTVEELIKPFKNKKVGMVGGHPIPENKENTFIGFCVNKLWQLHHEIALEHPKCGEIIAFRNIISRIPNYTAVDEATIEAMVVNSGFELAYAPKAIVYNKGPETLHDFIKQRRRIAAGHRHLQVTMGYKVTTLNKRRILKHLFKNQKWSPRYLFYTFFLIMIEMYSRFMGVLEFYLRDKNPFIWEIAKTTKEMSGSKKTTEV